MHLEIVDYEKHRLRELTDQPAAEVLENVRVHGPLEEHEHQIAAVSYRRYGVAS